MTATDTIEAVFHANHFESREQAETVMRATLRNLGRCLSAGEARDLAAPLPSKLSEDLVNVERTQAPPIAYEEFLERVGEEAAVSERTVEQRVQAVMAVLKQRVGEEKLENAQAQLPSNYGRIFRVESVAIGPPFEDFVIERTAFDPDVNGHAMVRAVLETLGERLSRGEAEDLSQYLEGEAKRWVVDKASPDAADLSADEFVGRVARRADVSEQAARKALEAVGDGLSEIVPPEEIKRARGQLPAEFDSLFGFEE